MSIPNWLARSAAARPAAPAILSNGSEVTYAELEQRASSVVADLLGSGIERGQRVAVVATPSADYLVLLHALMKVGAEVAPLDPRSPEPEIERRMTELRPALTIVDPSEIVTAAPDLGTPLPDALQLIEENAAHCVIYTSGAGGAPKPVKLTYGNHLWSALGSALRLGHAADDRWLLCMPLHHVGGLSIVLRAAIGGAAVAIESGFESAAFRAAVDSSEATLASLVPTMLKRLLEDGGAEQLRRLRAVLVGGAPLVPALREWAIDEGVPIAPTYGLTEAASQVATLAPHQLARKHAAAGLPLISTQVEIAGDGRIMVKGPTVAPAEADADGWLRTGDLGALDGGGYLYVLGRADSVIVTGGENVLPEEVERTLLQHPDVNEAAVFGREDPEWQAAVTARVVLIEGAEATDGLRNDLIEFCKARLPGFKAPKTIEFSDRLPQTSNGKLLRGELR